MDAQPQDFGIVPGNLSSGCKFDGRLPKQSWGQFGVWGLGQVLHVLRHSIERFIVLTSITYKYEESVAEAWPLA